MTPLAALAAAALLAAGAPAIEVPGTAVPLDLKAASRWDCPPRQAPRYCMPPPPRPDRRTADHGHVVTLFGILPVAIDDATATDGPAVLPGRPVGTSPGTGADAYAFASADAAAMAAAWASVEVTIEQEGPDDGRQQPAPVPLAGTMGLLLSGLAALAAWRLA